jgi:hypothetical protein
MTSVAAEENSCIDCHKTLSPFTAQEERFNQIRMSHIGRNVSCSLECHEDRILQLSQDNYNQWTDSAHAFNNVTCEKCHGGNPTAQTKDAAHKGIKTPTELDSPVYYKNVPRTCGKEGCHPVELEQFENSMHYQRLQAVKLAPSCSTCHAPHTFKVLEPEVFRGFCIQCHYVGKVAPVEIPTEAEYALESAARITREITSIQEKITLAKKEGKDMTVAQKNLDEAIAVVIKLPELWHAFNLKNFEEQEKIAKNSIDAARKEVVPEEPTPTPVETAAPGTPGFGIIAAGLGVFAIAVLRRNMR